MSAPVATLLGFALGADTTSPAAPKPELTGYLVATWSDPLGRLVRMRPNEQVTEYLVAHVDMDIEHVLDDFAVFLYEDSDGIAGVFILRKEIVAPWKLYHPHTVENGVIVHSSLSERARARVRWFTLDVIGADLPEFPEGSSLISHDFRLRAQIPTVIPAGWINKTDIATGLSDWTAHVRIPSPRTLAKTLDFLELIWRELRTGPNRVLHRLEHRDPAVRYQHAKSNVAEWTTTWLREFLGPGSWHSVVQPSVSDAGNRHLSEIKKAPLAGLIVETEFIERPGAPPVVEWTIGDKWEKLGRGNSPSAVLLAAGLVVEEDKLDDWFDTYLDPGTLTFNPGAYYALDEELPITMPWETFSEIAADLELPPIHDWPHG